MLWGQMGKSHVRLTQTGPWLALLPILVRAGWRCALPRPLWQVWAALSPGSSLVAACRSSSPLKDMALALVPPASPLEQSQWFRNVCCLLTSEKGRNPLWTPHPHSCLCFPALPSSGTPRKGTRVSTPSSLPTVISSERLCPAHRGQFPVLVRWSPSSMDGGGRSSHGFPAPGLGVGAAQQSALRPPPGPHWLP